tara:strand:- start:1273 stop:1623 length:351 start_codon:yes stop_codon:yes gene_type:complete
MKISKSTLKIIIQEEYTKIKQNESEMTAYDRDDTYNRGDEPSDSLKKIAGSDELATVLQAWRDHRGANGSWIVKVVGEPEFKEYSNTDEGKLKALRAWYRLYNKHDHVTMEWVEGI